MTDYAAARLNMVEGQIRPNKVTNPALVTAMMTIPRELFVPKPLRGFAYVDEDVHIGNGRFMMEPMVLSRLLQEAGIGSNDVVLDLGCGTGYSTAILSRIAGTVVAVEEDAELAARATELLKELGIDNAAVVEGRPSEGYPAQAPYDVIVINGAVAKVPEAVLEQLGEGGRLVAVVSADGRLGQARLFQRIGGIVSGRVLFDASTPILRGFEPEAKFEF